MRLLYVCSDWGIPPDGTKGASIHLRAITRALAELGHEVSLLSPKGVPGNDHPAHPALAERCVIAEDAARLLRDWLGARDLPGGIGREIRPLLFNAWALDRALAALRRNPPDAIIERLSLFGHLGLDLADALHVPLVLEVNAPLSAEAASYRALQLGDLARQIEQRALHHACRVAVVSRQLGDYLVAEGVNPEKVEVVPNGVEAKAFISMEDRGSVRRRLGLEQAFVVGFAGSLKPWHGVDVLLKAFAKLAETQPAAHLLIVGTGPRAEELQASVVQMNLEAHVTFTGPVPHEQMPSMLGAMDVAVAPFLPMDDFYFSPIKLFEYMAAGTCVLASRIGQIAEVIEDGVDGVLCEPGNAGELHRLLERLSHSPQCRVELGEKARTKALANYTWRRAAQQLESMIQSRLSEVAKTIPGGMLLSKAG